MGVKGGYPSDAADEEWQCVLPYLLLCRGDSPQREYDLRAVLNGVRWIAKTGAPWRWMPNDLPPWRAVYQQMDAGGFELLVEDVRSLLREWAGRKGQPTAVVIDSRTLQSTPEFGARAGCHPTNENPFVGTPGWDGTKRRKSSKVHIAVDTPGHLLALKVASAGEGDRAQVAALAEAVQEAIGERVELAFVDQSYTGPAAAEAAGQHASVWKR